jgi:two-component system nitrate/nitrite response regulator NarL
VIGVMVASDNFAVLDGLLSALSDPGVRLVGSPVTRAGALIESLKQRRPDVLLLDRSLLQKLDADTRSSLADVSPGAKVLVLSDTARAGLARTVLQNHFHGYVSGIEIGIVLKAIRSVHRGELWLPRRALAEAVYGLGRAPRRVARAVGRIARPVASLTPREQQVVNDVRTGCSNKEIASRLGIREDTVKKHLRKVFGKLGVRRRTQLVLLEAAAG